MKRRNWTIFGGLGLAATIALAAATGDRLKSPVLVGQGTAVTESISFDNGSGASNPTITALTSGNTLKLTSPVGINTATPGATLGVQGPSGVANSSNETVRLNAAATGDFMTFGVDSADRTGWIRAYRTGPAENSLLLQPLGGGVAIGASTPLAHLHVSGSGPNVTTEINLTDTAGGSVGIGMFGAGTTSRADFLYSAGALAIIPFMSVPNFGGTAGFVGIGTTAPTANLEVGGTTKLDSTLQISPLGLGIVETSSTGVVGTRNAFMASASFDGTGAQTASYSIGGSWTASHPATGRYTVSFNSTWTSSPICNVSIYSTSNPSLQPEMCILNSTPTTSSVDVSCVIIGSPGTDANRDFSLVCQGAR